VLRPGVLRIGIGTSWSFANDRFGRDGTPTEGKLEPLGADFTRDSLAARFFGQLAPLRTSLQSLTGASVAPLTLGRLRVSSNLSTYTAPITVELGLLKRLQIGVVVPYIKTRNDISVFANNVPGSANVGLNPGLSIDAVKNTNGAVVSEVTAAASRLAGELTRCLQNSDPTCSAINANRAAAGALVTQANVAATDISSIYGTTTSPGALFAPLGGSAIQQAVEARLASLATSFKSFLGDPTSGTSWISGKPVPAALAAYTDFQRLLSEPDFGISGVPLESVERSHLGDVSVGAKLLLFDGIGPPQAEARPGLHLRLAAAVHYRLATAQVETADDFADVGTGDKQPDVDAQGFADVQFGRRVWMSVVGRYSQQRADRIEMRITDLPGDPFPALYRRQEVQRNLGDVTEFEITPRWVPNDYFAFAGSYRVRRKGEDAYTGIFSVTDVNGDVTEINAATLGTATEQQEQAASGAFTYSTVRAFERGRARWPLEVTFSRSQVLTGTNALPKWSVTTVALRYYSVLFGAAMRPPRPPRRGRLGA
jgi:hypothetical protein